MNPSEGEFDDPGLRSAVQRSCGGEVAPPALRSRVERLFATAAAEAGLDTASVPSHQSAAVSFIMPWKLIVSAAAAILVVGVIAVEIKVLFFPSAHSDQTALPQASATFPMTVAVSMVKTHDNCAKLSDHHLLAGDDFTALAASLSKTGGIPVFASQLSDGWRFKGAGMCDCEGVKSAHLIYSRGNHTISIFSSVAPRKCGKGKSTVHRKTLDGHPLAGFVNDGAFYCVVGSSADNSLTVKDLDPIVDQVRAALHLETCRTPGSTRVTSTAAR